MSLLQILPARLLILLLALAGSARAAEGTKEGYGLFLSESDLATLIEKSSTKILLERGLTEHQAQLDLESIQRYVSGREYLQKIGQASDRACNSLWPSHRETHFANVEVLESGQRMPLEDLISRADVVVLAEVLEADVGYYEASLGKRVKARTLEVLRSDGQPLDPEIFYYDPVFTLHLGPHRFECSREGFISSAPGAEFLLLGMTHPRWPGRLIVKNFLPVRGGMVRPQPYGFLIEGQEVPLEALRQ